MIATLLRLAGIDVNVKYEICSWQSGQKNTSWIGPGGGGAYIYIFHTHDAWWYDEFRVWVNSDLHGRNHSRPDTNGFNHFSQQWIFPPGSFSSQAGSMICTSCPLGEQLVMNSGMLEWRRTLAVWRFDFWHFRVFDLKPKKRLPHGVPERLSRCWFSMASCMCCACHVWGMQMTLVCLLTARWLFCFQCISHLGYGLNSDSPPWQEKPNSHFLQCRIDLSVLCNSGGWQRKCFD